MDWEPGDILACYGSDLTSRVIRWGTTWPVDPWSCWSPPSHVAMICEFEGRLVLVESTTKCPRNCLVRGERVSGVQIHEPWDRVSDYMLSGGRTDLYRLQGIFKLEGHEQLDLQHWLISHFLRYGAQYDMRGAVGSGLRLRHVMRRLYQANLDQVFCSELLAAVLMRLGILNQDDPALYSPGRLLREIVRLDRYRLHMRDIAPLRIIREEAA
ncbi:hypothetical protein SH661x_001968 [Planctomicrobium sp. SH661]|uniref:hypothetical protein n=1 Tax=Planctomicrobium sp. SH661 TaxID=3448124 RepID=UPI003F5B48F8